MSRSNRNRHHKSDPVGKLAEFPENFHDAYFYNQTIEHDRRVMVLRNVVHKKIKTSIAERIAGYNGKIPMNDSFVVEFKVDDSFSQFQWAVIKEELLDCGFDPVFTFNEDELITKMEVPISREMKLRETLADREKEDNDE